MTIDLSRRNFLIRASAIIAAPAIVRYANIMPVRALAPEYDYRAEALRLVVR